MTFGAVIGAAAALILLVAVPSALLDTVENGRIYLFSAQFFEELPQRLEGPGRMRFLLQPLIAIALGCRAGFRDAEAGRPAYLWNLLFGSLPRRDLLRSGWADIRNVLAAGIACDAIAQGLIYGQIHPGAALVIGPVLICLPYSVSRALACRAARLMQGSARK